VSAARGLLRPARQATYDRVFGVVHTGLMTNVLLALACAPLPAALALVRDPLASWPFFAVLSLLCAPALTGAFGCFAALEQGSVVRAFWDGYRRGAGRALAVWAAATAAVSVLVVDAVVVAATPWGPALVPFFAAAAMLVVAVALALLVVIAETPRGVRPRRLVLPCLWLTARRWYLAPVNVAVLGLAVAVISVRPVIGMLVACAPLLYAVWANTRYVVASLLPRPSGA